ncbi:integrin alpha-8-like [Sycon ciliatum]|uniref:integrin alpha-8-like n=1 Tax=Sycon ciliatum TaxID=27933 RepID=UPI0031F694FC
MSQKVEFRVLQLVSVLISWCAVQDVVLAYNVDTTYPVIYSGRANSEFGYSIAFHSHELRPMLIIGAPNATYEDARFRAQGVDRTGVVFACSAVTGSNDACLELEVDITVNQRYANNSLHSEKSRMRLGSSVGSLGPDKGVVVCAAKYSTIWYKQMVPGGEMQEFYDPVGRCSILAPDVDRLTVPLSVFQPCDDPGHQGWHRLGYCMTGTSMDIEEYPDGNAKVAVSSPGAFYKRGMVWVATHNQSGKGVTDVRQVGLSQDTRLGDAQNGYGGYAVTQADFDGNGQVEVVMSRPRARTDFKGQVWVTESEGQTQVNIVSKIFVLLEGNQVGEYFGHSLAAVDTDADGKAELIIGSPNYIPESGLASMDYDYGRVVIYGASLQTELTAQHAAKNFSTARLKVPDKVIEGQQPGGHFGAAIADAGDVDNDGFTDIAVGAPYEMEEGVPRGAVYIFSGSSTGLESIAMQRISPLGLNMKNTISFGSVIAKSWDIDRNSYPDLLVSAVDSNQVVMMRARPIVDIDVEMIVQDQIDMVRPSCLHASGRHITCFKVSVCGKFNGTEIHSSVEIEYELEVDTMLKFDELDQQNLIGILQLKPEKTRDCREHVVTVKSETFNPCLPASVRLVQYTLKDRASKAQALSPVLNRKRLGASKSIEKQVLLIRNCPRCSPDIGLVDPKFTVEGSDAVATRVVHGRNQKVFLEFVVSSHGTATACSSMAKISLPPGVTFQQQIIVPQSPTVCVPSNNDATEAQCNLPALMAQSTMDKVKVSLGIGGIPPEQSSITVSISVKSFNAENGTLADNKATATISVYAMATLIASGVSRPRRMRLTSGNPEPKIYSAIGPMVTHVYSILNQGPSQSPPVVFSINFPMKTTEGSYLMYLTRVEGSSLRLVCNHTGLINPLYLGDDTLGNRGNLSSSLHRVRDFSSAAKDTVIRVESKTAEQIPKSCDDQYCWASIMCSIPQREANTSSSIELTWRVWMSHVRQSPQASAPINITSNIRILRVADQETFTLSADSTFVATATTQLVAEQKQQLSKLPWWVWLIGFLAGGLLIAVMVLLLRKCHFFQRKTLAQRVEESQPGAG